MTTDIHHNLHIGHQRTSLPATLLAASLIFLISILLPLRTTAITVTDDTRIGRFFSDKNAVAANYNAICMDRDGLIWIGTTNGLVKFDGKNYDIYRHDERNSGSISDNRILNILTDRKGRTWVGTANGLNLYDQEKDSFTVFDLPTGSHSQGYIIDITEQADSTVTFIASGIGLFIADDSKEKPAMVRFLSPTPGEKEFVSLASGKKNLYIGSHNGNIMSVAPNAKVTHITQLPSYVDMLAVETDSTLIAATTTEVYRVNTRTKQPKRLDLPTNSTILSIENDNNGKTYIGTAGQGILEVMAGSESVEKNKDIYSSKFDLSNAQAGEIYYAPDGRLWVGCDLYGVMTISRNPLPFQYVKMRDLLPDYEGTVEATDTWGKNIVAGLDNGLVMVSDEKAHVIQIARIPSRGKITDVSVRGDEVLIAVVGDGVWKMNLHSGALSQVYHLPGPHPIMKLGPSFGGKDYVGLHGEGVLAIDSKTGEKKWISRRKDGTHVGNGYVNVLCQDGDWLWIGHYDGLDRYNMRTGELDESKKQRLDGYSTFSILPTGGDEIMAGTSGGLIQYDLKTDKINKYTTAEGLADNLVNGLILDRNDDCWVSTMRGLSRIKKDGKLDTYLGGYGIMETEFKDLKLSSGGLVYAPNSTGITAFRPDLVPQPGFNKAPEVSAITLNGKRLVYGSDKGKEPVIEIPEDGNPIRIFLPYKENSIVLRLSMLQYRDESNIAYYWRLDKDKEWSQLGRGEDMLYLTHLFPGKHRLEIKAEENNVFSPVREFEITVAAPWYMSPIWKIIMVAVIVALCVLLWIVTKKKRQEKINDAKIKYFMDVSHDIRSPITLILDPIQRILDKTEDSDTRRQLKTMQRNAHRILSLVNQMLDIRKIEKGKMLLACRKTDISGFVKELVDLFQPQANDRGQTLTYSTAGEIPEMWLDRDNFDKILVNLISNAIKYTPKGGTIDVSTGIAEDPTLGKCAKISVTDTGIGLDGDSEKHLFERFYRDRKHHDSPTEGFGIGLDLCRRLVELHHGRISGGNRRDGVKGCVFTVLIPISESFYPKAERILKDAPQPSMETTHLKRAEVAANDSRNDEKQSRRRRASDGTILVVDDDAEIRDYICSNLALTYKVKSASNGVEALKEIQKSRIDLVVSDIVMPEKDGLSLLRQIKTGTETTHIPVVLLSSKSDVEARMEGWEKGADGYISKPFSIRELSAVIDNLLDNRLRMKGKYSGAGDAGMKIEAPKVKGIDQSLMEKILKAIEQNIDEPDFNVEKLSAEVGMSRTHLNRRMKEIMGMSPVNYIRNIRLKRASDLLKTSDIEVTQVAYTLGFTSQSHFSSSFKKYTGYSPSEYREKHIAGELEEQYESNFNAFDSNDEDENQ